MPEPLGLRWVTMRVLLLLIPIWLCGQNPVRAADDTTHGSTSSVEGSVHGSSIAPLLSDSIVPHENQRLVAAALALFLGPFGAHRLYFGTTAKVPIIYGITFGGFGLLALIDLGHILFTKDLSRYRDCDRVFMWARPKAVATPP